MASDYDDDDRDRRDDYGGREKGLRKASTPAIMLVAVGLLGLMMQFASIGLMVSNPTVMYDFFVQMVEKGPPGPEKQKQLDDLKAQEAGMRWIRPRISPRPCSAPSSRFLSLSAAFQ